MNYLVLSIEIPNELIETHRAYVSNKPHYFLRTVPMTELKYRKLHLLFMQLLPGYPETFKKRQPYVLDAARVSP